EEPTHQIPARCRNFLAAQVGASKGAVEQEARQDEKDVDPDIELVEVPAQCAVGYEAGGRGDMEKKDASCRDGSQAVTRREDSTLAHTHRVAHRSRRVTGV